MKNALLEQGMFPETLPPCFSSQDARRAFRGLGPILYDRRFHQKRNASPIPYNGTKHDGNRRLYATPHIIPYYYISDFIQSNWKTFGRQFDRSPYSISVPRRADDGASRAIVVTPLSEVSTQVGRKVKHSPFILKADIAQFYPNIYTHCIGWAAHGKERCKLDRSHRSIKNKFNRLDFFVQNAQSGQTRGVLIGPDAYRVIAEFIATKIDEELFKRARHIVVGAARHVDDYYIGVRTEADAAIALSHLRESLYEYELHVNDLKTAILPGISPFDDPWAPRLRLLSDEIANDKRQERIVSFMYEAVAMSHSMNTQSPAKLAIRRADRHRLYLSPFFDYVESFLQRMTFHFSHVIDYICLFVAKRVAIGEPIDRVGWGEAINGGLFNHLMLGHHHESCWLFWLSVVCDIPLAQKVVDEIPKHQDEHLMSLLVQAIVDAKIPRKPRIRLGSRLSSDARQWLTNIVARSSEFTKAPFSGSFADECEHLSKRNLQLIDFQAHLQRMALAESHAISNVRFGYEDEDEDSENNDDDLDAILEFGADE
jgi:hypothetical protein